MSPPTTKLVPERSAVAPRSGCGYGAGGWLEIVDRGFRAQLDRGLPGRRGARAVAAPPAAAVAPPGMQPSPGQVTGA